MGPGSSYGQVRLNNYLMRVYCTPGNEGMPFYRSSLRVCFGGRVCVSVCVVCLFGGSVVSPCVAVVCVCVCVYVCAFVCHPLTLTRLFILALRCLCIFSSARGLPS